MHDVRFPNESDEYRAKRNELLQAEVGLRAKIEEVAALRRELPMGGKVENYTFEGAQGSIRLSELFGSHNTLIIYSYMYGPNDDNPCPMCSAYMDSLNGQLKHITQRTAFAVVARAPFDKVANLRDAHKWDDIPWYSASQCTYAQDYKSEMPNGAQVPMCNVFVKDGELIYHSWCTEAFFVPAPHHPRHVDMLWPLWHYFDLLPQGRGEFMPSLDYEA